MTKIHKWIVDVAVFFVLTAGAPDTPAQTYDPKSTTQKFNSLLHYITFSYVDTLDEARLVEKAIVATLKELDPHSLYISKEDVIKSNETLEGNYEGIGITFQIYHDTIMVISPHPGGPSERAGLLAGDKIVRINGEDATGDAVDEVYVFKRLRGRKGTTVEVTVLRKAKKTPTDFTIRRDLISINSVDASYLITPEIGYIRLNRFSRNTADEFRDSLRNLIARGMSKLVLDLRGNTGGFLETAVELADEFLDSDKKVVYTEGRFSARHDYLTGISGQFEQGRLVILIDEGSASASEIVAGAVQDWDRGIIMGRRSFGKGLVQRQYYLPDSSAVRLTIARYYTPSGRCIQKSYKDGTDRYRSEIQERSKNGELAHADSIKFADSLKYYTHNHRLVYGGGGIMPDIFVPFDSTLYGEYYQDILRKGILNDFVLDYVENHRHELMKKYPGEDTFIHSFVVDEKLISDFEEYAAAKDVVQKKTARDAMLELQIKGWIARNLYSLNTYYRIVNSGDATLEKAIEVLGDESRFAELRIE
jgi:carboxyl-terminal processing protease